MKARTTQKSRIETTLKHSFQAAVLALALAIAGCGGGGGSAPAGVNGVASQTAKAANSFTVTGDDYGMVQPSYLSATSSTALGVVLRSAIASSMTDPNFKTVCRIDIPAGVTAAGVYSLGAAAPGAPAFPGSVYFFNGHPSSMLSTVGGSITFTSFGTNAGDRITGSFNAVVQDNGDSATPKPTYSIAATFDLDAQSSGPVSPAPPAATLAAAKYDANCATCHALGSYDTTRLNAPDLALKGGRMNGIFTADQVSHQGLRLAAADIGALKVLLNSN